MPEKQFFPLYPEAPILSVDQKNCLCRVLLFGLWAFLVLRLHRAVCWFLWKKKQTIHVSTSTVQSASTWSHAGGVEKNIYPTPKQTQKRNAAAKLSLPLKQSCGRIKTAANTKR
jgi:hypothetical protein